MPPRRQPSRPSPGEARNSSPDTSHSPQNSKKQTQDTNTHQDQPLGALLGGNPQFADQFFGEPSNMARPLRPATPEEHTNQGDMNMVSARNGHGDDGGDGSQFNSNQQSPVQGHASSSNNFENSPMSIDQLVVQQLREDLEAYRYDLDFARSQLDPENVTNITAAETRTFQLRVLDLGHQMRMVNHRIQLMQATMGNPRFANGMAGRAGAATSNAYWGPYPPGTSVRPAAYSAGSATIPAVNGQYGLSSGAEMSMMQSPATLQGHYEYPQGRRGPGRPLGSKNRPRQSMDPQQTPSVPANGSAKASALASAAALASAGAKRDHSSEIRVATPNGAGADEHLSKRPRLGVQVGSPMSNDPENDENVGTASKHNASRTQEDQKDLTAAELLHTSGGPVRPPPSGLAAPYGTSSAPIVPKLSAGSRSYDGPAGSEFKRLGGWRCRLCTSQKYLNTPPPKQPSEPGHWPLRDISKMITHFTRMHDEHNNVQRCMELGAALGANRGPFRHWLVVTKKQKGIDHEAIDAAVDELEDGRMPDILRKVSMSAANFPPVYIGRTIPGTQY